MKKLLFLLLLSLHVLISHANNIQVTNVVLQPASSTIQFTVSWDNGWRSSILNNWDAAYVFIKYKDVDGKWKTLVFNNTGNVIPAGFSSAYAVGGTFLYRSTAGSGATTITNVKLGTSVYQLNGIYDIKVFAIEMVYIPYAPFFVGDGLSGTGFYRNSSTIFTPGSVISEGFGGTLVYDPLVSPAGANLEMPNPFPRGVNPYYVMKYELSQGGYRDFLNCLTYNQQINHTVAPPSSIIGRAALVTVSGTNRNYLEIKTPGIASALPAVYGCDGNNNNIYDESSDGEWVACNYLNWPDMAAYLEWVGLRPISEFEYEKAARGIQLPVAGEYAWGNNTIASLIYILSNPSQNSESISNSAVVVGNASYTLTYPNSPFDGPLRNGIFATATSNRINSGGSFYGVMDMCGNIWERCISTANGQNFDGSSSLFSYDLTEAGYASGPAGYPGGSINGVDGSVLATGVIDRGGSWSSLATELRISNRSASLLLTTTGITRDAYHGCRGGRTAP